MKGLRRRVVAGSIVGMLAFGLGACGEDEPLPQGPGDEEPADEGVGY